MDPTTTATAEESRERLAQGLQQMVDEANHLLKDAKRAGGDQFSAVRDRFETQLQRAKAELRRLEGEAVDRTKRAAAATDHAVHEHPYTAMGIAAGVGLLIGMLISRR
jgi:ElaB/YqjD/DUF883 family membrane-anchored ribosome-binding protein